MAEISGLVPKELHVVRVTAVAPNGSMVWESPLVSLRRLETEIDNRRGWLTGMALVLVALLYWRWRISRAPA